MSHIIAGDPAPTKPQADSAVRSLINGGFGERQAREIIAAVRGESQQLGYTLGLRSAVAAARSEYLTDATGTDEDNAYNNGISDAVAAIRALVEAGESRG